MPQEEDFLVGRTLTSPLPPLARCVALSLRAEAGVRVERVESVSSVHLYCSLYLARLTWTTELTTGTT